MSAEAASVPAWPDEVHAVLKAAGVRQAAYVPDAGHARLIEALRADPEVAAIVLTTEEEGVAIAGGAWLGGQRSVLLMQSSGVGNCINTLSLAKVCGFPLLALVTMRGEWAEFNAWQAPMGAATEPALRLMGVRVLRVERAEEAAETVAAGAALAFDGDLAVAVLLSQRMLGRKRW